LTTSNLPSALTLPRRRTLAAIGSVLGSVALVTLSLLLVDTRQVSEHLAALDARWLAAFFAVYVAQLVLLGARWAAISRQLGVPLGWRRASLEYALSLLVNNVLPTGVAGDGFRALRHSQRCRELGFPRVLEVLALDRLSGQLALALVVLLSAPLTAAAGLIEPASLAKASVALGVVVLLGKLLLGRAAARSRFGKACAAFARRAGSVLLAPRRAAVHLPLSVMLTATLLLQIWISASAAGIHLSFAHLVWLGPLILLAASAPSFFGSWGVREGASAMLFATAGLPSSAGVTVSLLFGSFSLVCALPGALVLLFDRPAGASAPDNEPDSGEAIADVSLAP
jgi:glycosyltransferase 2 family protein